MTTAPAAPTKVEADIMSAFLTPAATIKAVENIGAVKANLPIIRMFMLGMLSGMYIAVGATVSLMVSRGLPSADPGLVKLVYGALFPVGLVLVVLAGAELITGNFAVVTTALLARKIKWWQALNNFFWVYTGNLFGSLSIAYFWVYLPQLFIKDPWLSGVQAIAEAKTAPSFGINFLSGMGCNWLVCLAVFLTISAKTVTCKIVALWWPIQTFATIGYEHCVANMFLVPVSILYGANVSFGTFITKNLIPATLGNAAAAMIFVGGFYWYIFDFPLRWPLQPKPVPTDSVKLDSLPSSPAPGTSVSSPVVNPEKLKESPAPATTSDSESESGSENDGKRHRRHHHHHRRHKEDV